MHIILYLPCINNLFVGLRSNPARLSYCKIDNLETETRMNNFSRSSFDNFQEAVEDEPVSLEFGMDPVIISISLMNIDYSLLIYLVNLF